MERLAHKAIFGFGIGILILWGLGHASCGGSSAMPQSSIPAPTLRIDGSVSSPSASQSISVPAIKKLTEAPAVGIVCSLLTLEGDDLGQTTTATDGTFLADVEIGKLKGTEDSSSNSWDETIVIRCSNGLQLLKNISVDETSTSNVSVGTVNTTSTFSSLAMAQQIPNWTDWGSDIKSSLSGVDITCSTTVINTVWSGASLTGAGLNDDHATIKLAIEALMASNTDPTTLGFSTWPSLLKSAMDGTMESGTWSQLVQIAAGVDSQINVETFVSNYSTAAQITNAVRSSFTSQFSSGGAGSRATDDRSVCDRLKAGELVADTLTKPVLVADDLTTFQTTFTSDGMAVLMDLAKTCITENNCDTIREKPAAYFEFFNSFEGDYAPVFDPTAGANALGVEGILFAAGSCTGENVEALRDCAHGVFKTIDAGGGFTRFRMEDGGLDRDRMDLMGGIWVGEIQSGTDPRTQSDEDFTNLFNQFDGTFREGGDPEVEACVNNLIAQGIYETMSCFPDDFHTIFDGSGSSAPAPQFLSPSALNGTYNRPAQYVGICPSEFINSTIAIEHTNLSAYPNANGNFILLVSNFDTLTNGDFQCGGRLFSQSCTSCSLHVQNNGGAGTAFHVTCPFGSGSGETCMVSFQKP